MISSITNQGKLRFMLYRETMRKLQNRPEHVRNYFKHHRIAYAA